MGIVTHTVMRATQVHNGVIENFAELRKEMMAEVPCAIPKSWIVVRITDAVWTCQGIPFKSQTDTEVIANLIGART
jgi:glucosamine 6-phosphate synthetase-like amidotransferase/phosphosugar isomerase protein